MPSCDPARLYAMAQHVQIAAQTADWERLGQLDALIQRWAQEVALSEQDGAQLQAWQALAQTHAQAFDACSAARQEAAAQLFSLQNSQEAQKAYAWQEILG